MSDFPLIDDRRVQQRIGDAERDRCVEDLTAAFTAGRLTQIDFERRSLLALEAATISDLDVLTRDLTVSQPSSDIVAQPSSAGIVLKPANLAKLVCFLTVVGALTFMIAGSLADGDMSAWFGLWFFGAVTGGAGALLARGKPR